MTGITRRDVDAPRVFRERAARDRGLPERDGEEDVEGAR
jgi:hypothetical protein